MEERKLKKEFDKSENDIKALQSVGQVRAQRGPLLVGAALVYLRAAVCVRIQLV